MTMQIWGPRTLFGLGLNEKMIIQLCLNVKRNRHPQVLLREYGERKLERTFTRYRHSILPSNSQPASGGFPLPPSPPCIWVGSILLAEPWWAMMGLSQSENIINPRHTVDTWPSSGQHRQMTPRAQSMGSSYQKRWSSQGRCGMRILSGTDVTVRFHEGRGWS